MSKLQAALALAGQGFRVFPLLENSKKPLIKDFPNKATTDELRIKAWWIDPVLDLERDYNIGISTSKFKDDQALIVIDVDNKAEKKGDESLELLEMLGNELPTTSVQTTPTGGKHLIFTHPIALKQGVSVLGNGLDIRSKGGYIVGSGSTLEGKYYRGDFLETPAAAPEWLVDSLSKAPEKSEEEDTISPPSALARAIHYLSVEAPESIKGNGGDQTAYAVAARVKDFGVSQTDCLDLMMEHWFEGSGWTPEKLEAKIKHAYKYGNEAIGAASPEAQFPAIEEATEAQVQHYLRRINNDHALVLVEGSYFIVHETIDEEGKPKRVFLNEQAFKRKFSADTTQKRETYATEWLDWKGRKEYAGICFAPGRDARNNYYNLWRGFTCEPLPYEEGNLEQQMGLDMFISHARENVCQGSLELFNWLMAYFAHMIQKPYERPLTTLVFRGGKGVGKNAILDRVGNLIGEDHYHVTQNERYLTSNFNGHMDSCLCLVLDEAIWSGDKNAEGILKGVTTAPTIMIERKGKETYKVANLVRLIVIGNDDWLVPASSDERRYAVLDVGDGKKQNKKFFKDMRIYLDEKGGNRLLLHYLQNFDLNLADINEIPKTDALLDQKLSSLEPFEAWWFSCLSSGTIMNSDFGDGWPDMVDVARFRQAFARTCRDRNIKSRLPDDRTIGRLIKKMIAVNRTKRREGENTLYVYKLPTLEIARNEWAKYIGQECTWET